MGIGFDLFDLNGIGKDLKQNDQFLTLSTFFIKILIIHALHGISQTIALQSQTNVKLLSFLFNIANTNLLLYYMSGNEIGMEIKKS